jgi:hypothetical protein
VLYVADQRRADLRLGASAGTCLQLEPEVRRIGGDRRTVHIIGEQYAEASLPEAPVKATRARKQRDGFHAHISLLVFKIHFIIF